MNKILHSLNVDDRFFLTVLAIMSLAVFVVRDVIDVIFLICILSLYLKHKLFN